MYIYILCIYIIYIIYVCIYKSFNTNNNNNRIWLVSKYSTYLVPQQHGFKNSQYQVEKTGQYLQFKYHSKSPP